MNELINDFIETMKDAMLENFRKDGMLQPVMFFLINNRPTVGPIPHEFLKDYGSKVALASIIKKICENPDVQVAGLLFDAYARSAKPNSELVKLLQSGAMRVSELKEKDDVIILIASTPENDYLFCTKVNPETKEVLEPYPKMQTMIESDDTDGVFSKFFSQRKKTG